MNFIILKKNYEDEMLIIDFLKSLLGSSIKIDSSNEFLIVHHNYNDFEDIKRSINALAVDLSFNPYGYIAINPKNDIKEIDIVLKLLAKIKSGIYDLKSALTISNSIDNKKEIFEYIVSNTGLDEDFIKAFGECDLNISKASKAMFIHRNTLIYKLDKFYTDTGFDLRRFKDMYILYELVIK